MTRWAAVVLLLAACARKPAPAAPVDARTAAAPAAPAAPIVALDVPADLRRKLTKGMDACPRPDRSPIIPPSFHPQPAPPGERCGRELAAAGKCVEMTGPPDMSTSVKFPHVLWTGDRVLVWDGKLGFLFDPAANTWTPMGTDGPAPPAEGHKISIWSGRELLVWHSNKDGDPIHVVSAYDPAARRWREAGRTPMPSIRRGDKIYGFYRLANDDFPHPASFVFDPATGKKHDLPPSPLSMRDAYEVAYTGSALVVWGGRPAKRPGENVRDGARLDLDAEAWQMLPADGAPSARHSFAMRWDGERVVLTGGWQGNARLAPEDGAAYDPRTNRWSALRPGDGEVVPARVIENDGGRIAFVSPSNQAVLGPSVMGEDALPLGTEAWQRSSVDDNLCDTAMQVVGFGRDEILVLVAEHVLRYRPADGSWAPLELFAAPRERVSYVWTGSALLAWGGEHDVTTDKKEECPSGEEGGGTQDCQVVERTVYGDGVIYRP